MMIERIKQMLKQSIERKELWARNLQSAQQAAPLVQKSLEQDKWQLDIVSTMPESVSEIPDDQYSEFVALSDQIWSGALPIMPTYDESMLATGVAVTNTAGSAAFAIVTRAAELPEPAARAWSAPHKASYVRLQENQDRMGETRVLLRKLYPNRANEFDDAERKYRAWRLGSGDRSGAAIALRNVLEHIKGDLMMKAMRKPPEQHIDWRTMAERLAIGGSDDSASKTLIELNQVWNSLHTRLIEIGKNLDAGVVTDLESVFVEWVDLLHSMLILTSPS